jgi:hypothetical protein
MYKRGIQERKTVDAPGTQVVVKLKQDRKARSALHALAAEGRMPAGRALGAVASVEHRYAMEPLFPVEGARAPRGARGVRAMAADATQQTEPALAGLHVVSTPSEREAQKVTAELAKDPLVELAYVIPPRHLLAARRRNGRSQQADPLLNRQWGLNAIALLKAESLASFPPRAEIVVAVIDSGVDSRHPDLSGVFVEERSFTSGPLRDTSGHGTHVSGIIGALLKNGRGIRGVLRSARIMSLKALDPYSGPGYYRALRYATDNGARVINLSLGGPHDPTEEMLVRRAIQRGVAVVAAMGNEKLKGNATSYPAAVDGVIAVGASDEADRVADFSCTGPHISLLAPGVSVLSTVPRYRVSLTDTRDYDAWPGTSMATPHVAATVALLLARRPAATVAGLRRALTRSADKVPGQRGFDHTHGHGRLNVRRALAAL